MHTDYENHSSNKKSLCAPSFLESCTMGQTIMTELL